jgi:hypothetical protein
MATTGATPVIGMACAAGTTVPAQAPCSRAREICSHHQSSLPARRVQAAASQIDPISAGE